MRTSGLLCSIGLVCAFCLAELPGAFARPVTVSELLAGSKPQDWRVPDPQDTLYLELPGGRVVIELAPQVAPRHVANIKALVRAHYFDGLAVVRVQDNYVVQWADPAAGVADHRRAIPGGGDRRCRRIRRGAGCRRAIPALA